MGRIRLSVDVPVEIVEEIDWIAALLGFDRREQFIEAAIRRLLDRYRKLTKQIIIKE